MPESRPGGPCPGLPARSLRTNSPQATQSSCCPATTVGRESPGLKLASSSPPRQFHHSLWQRGPCGEVTTEARLSQDNKGLGKGSTEQSPALPSWSAPSWKLEKHIKSRSICMYGTQLLLCFCSSSMSAPIRYTLFYYSRNTNTQKGKQTFTESFKMC